MITDGTHIKPHTAGYKQPATCSIQNITSPYTAGYNQPATCSIQPIQYKFGFISTHTTRYVFIPATYRLQPTHIFTTLSASMVQRPA